MPSLPSGAESRGRMFVAAVVVLLSPWDGARFARLLRSGGDPFWFVVRRGRVEPVDGRGR